MTSPRRAPAWIAGAALLLLGCSDPTPNEARLLLDRVGRLDPDDLESRRALVESLRAMPLTSDEVAEARDACVRMHAALLRAEDLSAQARVALEQVERAGEPVDPEARQRIEASISASQEAIVQVRTLEPECHGRLEALRARHGGGGR